jgi:hypothetical protein
MRLVYIFTVLVTEVASFLADLRWNPFTSDMNERLVAFCLLIMVAPPVTFDSCFRNEIQRT